MKNRIGNLAQCSTLIARGAFLLALNIASLNAQTAPPTAIRGTVGFLKDRDLIVATPAGDVRIVVTDKTIVRGEVSIKISEITNGMYLGTTATKQADGSFLASEVHVFSEDQ